MRQRPDLFIITRTTVLSDKKFAGRVMRSHVMATSSLIKSPCSRTVRPYPFGSVPLHFLPLFTFFHHDGAELHLDLSMAFYYALNKKNEQLTKTAAGTSTKTAKDRARSFGKEVLRESDIQGLQVNLQPQRQSFPCQIIERFVTHPLNLRHYRQVSSEGPPIPGKGKLHLGSTKDHLAERPYIKGKKDPLPPSNTVTHTRTTGMEGLPWYRQSFRKGRPTWYNTLDRAPSERNTLHHGRSSAPIRRTDQPELDYLSTPQGLSFSQQSARGARGITADVHTAMPETMGAPSNHPKGIEVPVKDLADQVYRLIETRLRIEKERRGIH